MVTAHVDVSTQKPILNRECFSTITLTWEDLQIKSSSVSNYIKANLTAAELRLLAVIGLHFSSTEIENIIQIQV